MKIVLDAKVWIDLHIAGLDERALALRGRICSVDVVVEQELLEPDGERLRSLGLEVCELDATGVAVARQWQGEVPELSTGDCFSLALAWRNGWRLATADGRLVRKAQAEGVPVCDTVDVLALLAEEGQLSLIDLQLFKKLLFRAKQPYNRSKVRQLEKRLRG